MILLTYLLTQYVNNLLKDAEEEQEKNAIISYQELVEAVKAKKEMMGSVSKETVSNVPSNAVVEAIESIEVEEPVKEESKKILNNVKTIQIPYFV